MKKKIQVNLIDRNDKVLQAQRERDEGFEPLSLELWRSLCRYGGDFVDAGAYTGVYSWEALKAGASRVFAFEPNPECFTRLIANSRINDHFGGEFSAFPVALSNNRGELKMAAKGGLTSAAHVSKSGKIHINCIPLDAFEFDRLIAIKVDVERFECEFLEGAKRTIMTHKPHIIVELLDGVDEFCSLLPIYYNIQELDKSMFHIWW